MPRCLPILPGAPWSWNSSKLVRMVLVGLEGERACRLGPYDRARCTLVYLQKHDTLEQIVAGFGIGVATAWRCVNDTIEQLGSFAPSLTETLTSHHTERIRRARRHRRRDHPGAGSVRRWCAAGQRAGNQLLLVALSSAEEA
ncbi:transposase family protein [Streptomyces chartreusis]|uniref:transposase family protein n=1 Tax=Streptomyces chartreusis TaxID=1969 RepID=UPI0036911B5C